MGQLRRFNEVEIPSREGLGFAPHAWGHRLLSLNDLSSRRSIVETFASLLSANLILAGVGFFTSIALASTMGAASYGDLAYAMAVGGYVLTFAYCGFDQSLLRDLIHHAALEQRLVLASLLVRGALLVVGLAALLILAHAMGLVHPLGGGGWLLVLACAVPAMGLTPVFDAQGRIRHHTILYVVERGTYFAFIWSLLVVVPGLVRVGTVAIGLLLGSILGLGLQFRTVFSRLRAHVDGRTLRLAGRLVSRNLWLWTSALAQLSFGALSKIVLGNEAGSAELGAYAIAWLVVTVGSLFTAQIGRIGNPRLVAVTRPGVPRRVRIRFLLRYLSVMCLVSGLIAVPALIAPGLLLDLVGPGYRVAARALRILAAYVVLNGMGYVGVQYLVAVRLERTYGLTLMGSALLSAVLLAMLVPRMGSEGAALAAVSAHGLALVIYAGVAILHGSRLSEAPT